MRKKTTLLSASILVTLLFIAQSCSKDSPYFRYRYAIVQTLDSKGETVSNDAYVPQSQINLRIWIVPERYYDRFSFNPVSLFVNEAHAGILTTDKNTFSPEENDSLRYIDIWYLPGSPESIADSTTLSSFVQYKVQNSITWMFEKQAVAYFNQQSAEGKIPQYIDVRFDKFFHYTGYGYFSLKLYTGRTRPYLYSTSNLITLF